MNWNMGREVRLELLELLRVNSKDETDVRWVGNADCKMSWKEFYVLLLDSERFNRGDSAFRESFPGDLILRGDDFIIRPNPNWGWYEDPFWECIEVPVEPENTVHLRSLIRPQFPHYGWQQCTLKDLVEKEETS